jgi:hypothetical protein
MAKIFINYRNSDAGAAVLLKHVLSERFGDNQIFLAAGMIPPGSDFERELLLRVRGCEVLLAVIGPAWLNAIGASGGRALDDDTDWVRREIAEAFSCGATVVPVLLDQTERLTDAQLPHDIETLRKCQYIRLRQEDFQSDLDRIADELGKYAQAQDTPKSEPQGINMQARATGHGRVHQAGRDQVINE